MLDFNDLEINAVKILCHPDGEAVRHYARRWKAILVDEFQDTNPVQAELLQLIGANAIQTIVGDEKQPSTAFAERTSAYFSVTERTFLPLTQAATCVCRSPFEPIRRWSDG